MNKPNTPIECIERELARKWWKSCSRDKVGCDFCSCPLPRDEGYLLRDIVINGGPMISKFDELIVCQDCFRRYTRQSISDSNISVMISSNVLWDVNLLLGINVFSYDPSPKYNIQEEPSPWEIALILKRLETYIQALVLFDNIGYLCFEDLKHKLHDHNNKYTKDNPLQQIEIDSIGIEVDPGHNVLVRQTETVMVNKKGFTELFHSSPAYKIYDNPQGYQEFASHMISQYWASKQLPFDFFANPFESPFASFDIANENLKDKNRAMTIALNMINDEWDEELNSTFESAHAFNIQFPAIFATALLESKDFDSFFRIVFELRDEAVMLRKDMSHLDMNEATREEILEVLNEITKQGENIESVAKIGDYFSIGPSIFIFSFGISLGTITRNLAKKKLFMQRMYSTRYRRSSLSKNITRLFGSIGIKVKGAEVIDCIGNFFN